MPKLDGTYLIFEHTPMCDRETSFTIKTDENGAVTGEATIDAAPGVIETLPFLEASVDGNSFSYLIEYGGMGRRYTGEIINGKAKGFMSFGDIKLEFDDEKHEAPEGAPEGMPPMGGPGAPGGMPPMGGPGGMPPMGPPDGKK